MALFTRSWAWSSVSQDFIGEAGGRFSRPAHILSLCLFPITGKKHSLGASSEGTPDIENVKRYNVKGWQGASTHPICYVLTFNVFVFALGKGGRSKEEKKTVFRILFI